MSQANWTRPLILAAALFALGSFAYWLEYSHRPKQEQAEESSKKLVHLKDTQISQFRMVEGAKAYTFHCLDEAAKLCKPGDNSKWELTEPSKLKADDSMVNSVISSVYQMTSVDSIDLKEETPQKRVALLREYRLDERNRSGNTSRRIEITDSSGHEQVIYFGDTHPIGDNIYVAVGQGKAGDVKVDETRVFLVGAYAKSNFGRGLTYWRDKKIMALAAPDVVSFRLEGSRAKVHGEKKDNQWVLTDLKARKPEEMAGDIENIDSMLTAAAYLTAKDFVTDDKKDKRAKRTLRGAKAVLTLAMKRAKDVVTLVLYRKGKGPKATIYGTVSNMDPLYGLDNGSVTRLDKDLKDLRLMKLITTMDRFGAKRIVIEGGPLGAQPLSLVSTDSKWTYGPGVTGDVNQDKVQNLLDKLSGNRIRDFVSGKAIPKGENAGLRVTLYDEKPEPRRSFVFWKLGDKLYGRDLLAKRAEAFVIDPAVRDALPWDRKYFDAAVPAGQPSPLPGKK